MVFAIVNQKGGVGKTTTAINLAAALAERSHSTGDGRPVLLIDMDSQANATEMSGATCSAVVVESMFDALVDTEGSPIERIAMETRIDGVMLAPGHRALAGLDSALREVAGKEVLLRELLEPVYPLYCDIVIDNGPALGLAIAISLSAADVAVVPVASEPLALQGLQQVSQTIEQARRRLNPKLRRRVLVTMVDGRNAHSRPLAATVREKMGADVLTTQIGHSADLQRGLFHKAQGASVLRYAPNSSAAAAFRALADELSGAPVEEARAA